MVEEISSLLVGVSTLILIIQIVGVDEMPRIDRPRGPVTASEEDKKEFSALFDGDSDSDDETR